MSACIGGVFFAQSFLESAGEVLPMALGGAAVGVVLALVATLRAAPRHCPKCGAVLPKFRRRAGGGWTCPNPACGIAIDRHGQPAGD